MPTDTFVHTFTAYSSLFSKIASRIATNLASQPSSSHLRSFEDLMGMSVTVIPRKSNPNLPMAIPCMKTVTNVLHEVIAVEDQITDDTDPTAEKISLLLGKHETEYYSVQVVFSRTASKPLKVEVFYFKRNESLSGDEYLLVDAILAVVRIKNTDFLSTVDG